jgi:hypothetical protein
MLGYGAARVKRGRYKGRQGGCSRRYPPLADRGGGESKPSEGEKSDCGENAGGVLAVREGGADVEDWVPQRLLR